MVFFLNTIVLLGALQGFIISLLLILCPGNLLVGLPAERGRGTIPHYQVASFIDDALKDVDTQMEFVLKLIRDLNNRVVIGILLPPYQKHFS